MRKSKQVVLISLLFILNNCFLIKQGYYLFKIQRKKEKINNIIIHKKLPNNKLKKLQLVKDIKKFAIQSLGLKNDSNYTYYVNWNKNYLINVVSASKKDSFEDYKWSLPLFGSFPYKGFFNRKDALDLAEDLKNKGYDVLVRKADAFSTLGYFSDPLFSFMLNYSEY